MQLPTLYSRTNTGAIQTWVVEIQGNKYRTIHGQLHGKLQTTIWVECDGKNIGRANETSPEEQALNEASSMWTKKSEKGYFLNIDDIDSQLYVSPMLAKKWEDRKSKIKYPIYCQPKLDGLRAVIKKDGAFTRNGKRWVTIPHILDKFKPLFEENPFIVLDGELYNHQLHDNFNKITSLVKKAKPTDKDIIECGSLVQFWWYDICDSTKKFSERNKDIHDIIKKYGLEDCGCIVPVNTYIANDEEELDKLYGRFLEYNYEGQMIREDEEYEFKRSSSLLKRKEFQDDEYEILDVIEGEGNKTGVAGSMLFKNHLGHFFNSNIKGDMPYLKEILDNKEDYIGKLATIRYFNLTPDKLIPRFPYVYGIRDYE